MAFFENEDYVVRQNLPGWLGPNFPGGGDYERGRRDGQEARRRDDAQREYERGYRDGYGGNPPYIPYPSQPHISWGGPLSGLHSYSDTNLISR